MQSQMPVDISVRANGLLSLVQTKCMQGTRALVTHRGT
jgi:hypothetical protein